MTVSTLVNKEQFNGDDATVSFPVNDFIVLSADDVVVIHRDASDVETTWTSPTDYSVAGTFPGKPTITAVTAPASGETLTIKRVMNLTQLIDYITGGKFPAETHEQGLDRQLMISQQLEESLGRAIKMAETSTFSDIEMPEPTAEYYLRWNSAGNGLENQQLLSAGDLTVSAFIQTLLDDLNAAAALTTLGVSAYIQTLLDDTTAAAARTTLGVDEATDRVVKSANESVTSSTTLQDDDELTITLPNEDATYKLDMFIVAHSLSATPDFKYSLVASDGILSVVSRHFSGSSSTVTTAGLESGDTDIVSLTANVESFVHISGLVRGYSPTGGTVKLQWAQNTSDAQATTVRSRSYIRVTKLG